MQPLGLEELALRLELTAPLSKTVRGGFRWLGFEPDPELPGALLEDFAAA